MVYFVGHCVLLKDNWAPLTNVPIDIVDISKDNSSRRLDKHEVSLQLLWQRTRCMQPLSNCVVKTTFLKLFQNAFRRKLAYRKMKSLPKFLIRREIGL